MTPTKIVAGAPFVFEGTLRLETEACPRCAGSGLAPRRMRNLPPTCWNCRGTGRHPSRAALSLYYEICALLGRPVTKKEGRIDPTRFNSILGKEIRPAMRVARQGAPMHIVLRVAPAGINLRLTLRPGPPFVISPIEYFDRELSRTELQRVQRLLRANLGKGAVRAR